MMKYLLLLTALVMTGCGVSEDCFKNSGSIQNKNLSIADFDKIRVHSGIELVVKQGANYNIRIESGQNIIDNIEVSKEGEFLIVKGNTTCNWTRDYKAATVYVTTPNLIEIHSKTEQDIRSDGILSFPILRLFSLDGSGESGTGDFYLTINNGQTVVESNYIANFYLNGYSNELLLNFYFGDGRFYGENLEVENIKVFHRGSNDMIIKPIQSVTGKIESTGNVILKNNPPIIDVQQLFTGILILN